MGAAQGLHAEFGRDKTSLSGRLRRFAKRCFQAPAPVWGCADYARYCTLAALVFPFVWVPGANRPSAGPGHPATGAGTGSATRRGQRPPLRGSCRAPLRAQSRTGRATSPGAGHRHGHRRAGGMGHGEPYRAQFLQCAGQTSSRRRVPDKGSKRQAGGMQKKQRWEGSVIHKRVNKFHHVINLLFVPTLFPLCSRFVPAS